MGSSTTFRVVTSLPTLSVRACCRFLWCSASHPWPRSGRPRAPIACLAAAALLVTLDEVIQLAIPSRAFEWKDLAWSLTGVLVFGLIATGVQWIGRRRRVRLNDVIRSHPIVIIRSWPDFSGEFVSQNTIFYPSYNHLQHESTEPLSRTPGLVCGSPTTSIPADAAAVLRPRAAQGCGYPLCRIIFPLPRLDAQQAPPIACRVQHAHDRHTVRTRQIEDQVIVEVLDPPLAQPGQFGRP